MFLRKLLKDIPGVMQTRGVDSVTISDIVYDSEKCTRGLSLYVLKDIRRMATIISRMP